MNMISTAEKIEAIVLSHLRNRAIGTFGSISESDGVYDVHADRRVVTVRSGRYGWEVRHGCLIGINHDLLEATRDALGDTVSDDYPFRAIVNSYSGVQVIPVHRRLRWLPARCRRRPTQGPGVAHGAR